MIKKIMLTLTGGLLLGLAGTSNASSCNITDVKLSGNNADACGWGPDGDTIANTPTNSPQLPGDYTGWDVNVISAGGITDWQFAYKRELEPDGSTPADVTFGADPIDLQITSSGGDNLWSTGDFTVNAYDPLLIVLGDGEDTVYHWYRFDGYSGLQTGSWTDIFGGKDVSNIAAYTTTDSGLVPPGEIPVPAAVWLFGSGLLGLVGVARRRKS